MIRVSLNREVRLLLNNWNLGTATKIAVKTATDRLFQRLRLKCVVFNIISDIEADSTLENSAKVSIIASSPLISTPAIRSISTALSPNR
ncbi:MAG: hypothetical protein V7L21_04265 [Nostoc sp.]|uniref:hypothetical protein n=1 Tax=unclassified Nostoc TaxID=2593658 RepID=UPI0025DA0550|nr:hypothetical protein [Nostoc sp. NMS9]MBN3944925.1 hypothetical protein [Nostoc sp. NMS9]